MSLLIQLMQRPVTVFYSVAKILLRSKFLMAAFLFPQKMSIKFGFKSEIYSSCFNIYYRRQ